MALPRNPWQAYRQVATETASPGRLVLLLYEGAIRFLEQARTGFGKDDPCEHFQTINNGIIRAQAIVNELDHALQMEAGGELARHLRQLYRYMDARLQDANIQKSEEGILDVISRLNILRESWSEMLQKTQGDQDMNSTSRSAGPRTETATGAPEASRQP